MKLLWPLQNRNPVADVANCNQRSNLNPVFTVGASQHNLGCAFGNSGYTHHPNICAPAGQVQNNNSHCSNVLARPISGSQSNGFSVQSHGCSACHLIPPSSNASGRLGSGPASHVPDRSYVAEPVQLSNASAQPSIDRHQSGCLHHGSAGSIQDGQRSLPDLGGTLAFGSQDGSLQSLSSQGGILSSNESVPDLLTDNVTRGIISNQPSYHHEAEVAGSHTRIPGNSMIPTQGSVYVATANSLGAQGHCPRNSGLIARIPCSGCCEYVTKPITTQGPPFMGHVGVEAPNTGPGLASGNGVIYNDGNYHNTHGMVSSNVQGSSSRSRPTGMQGGFMVSSNPGSGVQLGNSVMYGPQNYPHEMNFNGPVFTPAIPTCMHGGTGCGRSGEVHHAVTEGWWIECDHPAPAPSLSVIHHIKQFLCRLSNKISAENIAYFTQMMTSTVFTAQDIKVAVLLDRKPYRLGGGVFGDVFLAKSSQTDRICVIKTMKNECIDISEFLREAFIMCYLSEHTRYTTQYYGLVSCRNPALTSNRFEWAIAYEFVGSSCVYRPHDFRKYLIEDAQKYNSAHTRFQWLAVVIRMVYAVQRFHYLGVLLNDIKMDNILMKPRSNEKGYDPVFIDFGLASICSGITLALDVNESNRDSVMNEYSHIAPEVLFGAETTPNSDIYSLGKVMGYIADEMRVEGLSVIARKCSEYNLQNRPTLSVALLHLQSIYCSHPANPLRQPFKMVQRVRSG